mmetsp:Transcript_100559/g.319462  ORF Transcript_100559/g.319462 Transcript_100559/m.319462 type:complete len:266 (-) Transcript_100559:368-1165(-)
MTERIFVARHREVGDVVGARMPVHCVEARGVAFAVVLQLDLVQLRFGKTTYEVHYGILRHGRLPTSRRLETGMHRAHHAKDVLEHVWQVRGGHEETAPSSRLDLPVRQLAEEGREPVLHGAERRRQEAVGGLILVGRIILFNSSSLCGVHPGDIDSEVATGRAVRDAHVADVAAPRHGEGALPGGDHVTQLLRAADDQRPSAHGANGEGAVSAVRAELVAGQLGGDPEAGNMVVVHLEAAGPAEVAGMLVAEGSQKAAQSALERH